ncbi:hypothetical protein V5738_06805 [Salinisphaera sp. SPP-AMP-43]
MAISTESVRLARSAGAFIDDAANLAGVGFGIFRRTPDTRDAKLAAATLGIVMRAEQSAPRMTAAFFDPPTVGFGMRYGLLDVLAWMLEVARHASRSIVLLTKLVVN